MDQSSIPQKIWFLWFQGEADMPEIVKMCFKSWQMHNPTWQIHLLTNDNLASFTNVEEEMGVLWNRIPLAAQSDLIRITLLEKHGGVWVDASTFCNQPLNDWLPSKLASGFFAFASPNTDRLLSSWFMAALPESDIVKAYAQASVRFWKQYQPSILLERQKQYSGIQAIAKWIYRKNPVWAVKSGFARRTRISHYFWFHYLFSWLVQTNTIINRAWENTPKLSADGPHTLLHYGYTKSMNSMMQTELDNPSSPLYKLNWRFKLDDIPGSPMAYLSSKKDQ